MEFPVDKKVLLSFKGKPVGYYINNDFIANHGHKSGYLEGDKHVTLVGDGLKGEVYGTVVSNQLILNDGRELSLEVEDTAND